MVLPFQIDPDKNEKLFKKFQSILKTKGLKNEKVILNCFINKVELKCRYGDPIDTIICDIESEMNKDDPNWWVELLD